MTTERCLQVVREVQAGVLSLMSLCEPGEGLILILDMTHPTCHQIAMVRGVTAAEIDAKLPVIEALGGTWRLVYSLDANDAIRFVSTQATYWKERMQELLAKARQDDAYLVGCFLGDILETLLLRPEHFPM